MARFAAKDDDDSRLVHITVRGKRIESDLNRLFDECAKRDAAAVALFPDVKTEDELVAQLARLNKNSRWAVDYVWDSKRRVVRATVKWKTSDVKWSVAMGFAPLLTMPLPRRAPYVAIALWPGAAREGNDGDTVGFIDMPSNEFPDRKKMLKESGVVGRGDIHGLRVRKTSRFTAQRPGPTVALQMPRQHITTLGEHLAAIADRYGFRNPDTIWSDPANAELRSVRKTPAILAAGDAVTIPDKTSNIHVRPTGARHRFVLSALPLRLQLTIVDWAMNPIQGTADVDIAAIGERTIGADGRLDIEIDPREAGGALELDVDESGVVRIGFLQPVETDAGLRARLVNLGYLVAGVDLAFAVAEFQADRGLVADGEPDAATRSALEGVHGC